jgi:hypothetical protein
MNVWDAAKGANKSVKFPSGLRYEGELMRGMRVKGMGCDYKDGTL